MKDMYNRVAPVVGLNPQTISTNTTTTGSAIDLQGFEGCLITFQSGAIAGGSAANVFTPLITECDTSGGTYTAVSDDDLEGTEAAAVHNGLLDNQVTKIGYKGSKQFIKVAIVSTATQSGGGIIGATVTNGHKHVL